MCVFTCILQAQVRTQTKKSSDQSGGDASPGGGRRHYSSSDSASRSRDNSLGFTDTRLASSSNQEVGPETNNWQQKLFNGSVDIYPAVYVTYVQTWFSNLHDSLCMLSWLLGVAMAAGEGQGAAAQAQWGAAQKAREEEDWGSEKTRERRKVSFMSID